MKKADKKRPMLLATAARLLEEEYPEMAFSAAQLGSMCRKRVIPCINMPTCGMSRKYRNMVYYPQLVSFLKRCQQTAIS